MANTQISSIERHGRTMEQNGQLPAGIFNTFHKTSQFGRRRLIRSLPFSIEEQVNILEVDCGAGRNLQRLARWLPNARITGMDTSSRMIERAGQATADFWRRVDLLQDTYLSGGDRLRGKMDLILFSYRLSASNSAWRDLILKAQESLRPGGLIAVVDFHHSGFPWFKNYMNSNHVRMDGHLLPVLDSEFKTVMSEVHSAYAGLWEYFLYLGQRNKFAHLKTSG